MSDEAKKLEAEEADQVGVFFRATTPNGRWLIEVRKDPPRPDGDWYTGVVTLDGSTTVEVLTTDDTDKLLNWCRRQMVEAMRRG